MKKSSSASAGPLGPDRPPEASANRGTAFLTLSERSLVAWARAAAPEEACGLCFARVDPPELAGAAPGPGAGGARILVTRCANVSADPRRSFVIDPLEWVAHESEARARGLVVCGYWHSHPRGSAALSRRDAEDARRVGAPPSWILPVVGLAGAPQLRVHDARLVRTLGT